MLSLRQRVTLDDGGSEEQGKARRGTKYDKKRKIVSLSLCSIAWCHLDEQKNSFEQLFCCHFVLLLPLHVVGTTQERLAHDRAQQHATCTHLLLRFYHRRSHGGQQQQQYNRAVPRVDIVYSHTKSIKVVYGM